MKNTRADLPGFITHMNYDTLLIMQIQDTHVYVRKCFSFVDTIVMKSCNSVMLLMSYLGL